VLAQCQQAIGAANKPLRVLASLEVLGTFSHTPCVALPRAKRVRLVFLGPKCGKMSSGGAHQPPFFAFTNSARAPERKKSRLRATPRPKHKQPRML
jgi:hypothetical protein